MEAVMQILEKQLKKYDEIKDLSFINEIHRAKDPEKAYSSSTRKFYWKDGDAYFAFSRYKDMPLSKVVKIDPKFMRWLINSDFPEDLKHIVARALNGGI